VPRFLGRFWAFPCALALVASALCVGCSFPDYAADLDDGAGADAYPEGGADAADVSPHDGPVDATDGGGETHTDAVDASDGECNPETSGGLDASSCTSCALSKCSSQLANCQSTAACKAFIDCTSTCRCESPSACFLDCHSAHPSPEADALDACLASNCLSECSG
jgi:hypothetical protein